MARLQARRSPVDGKFRRWEKKWASALGFISQEDAWQVRSDGTHHDWEVWVCTGVFKSRREVFK
jgi:hypothetical protein